MVIDSSNAKRCGIFLYFDKEGKADRYVEYLLSTMSEHLDRLLVVCNGFLDSDARTMMKKYAQDVICKANVGMDVSGYREGLFYLGFKELAEYDEVILFNYTFFGPFYPWSEMFDAMDKKDVDFWGITKHNKVPFDPYGKIRYGYIPEHIQSHFIALRRDFLTSFDYKDFIFNYINPKSYVDSICDYEVVFTKHFEDLGYKWDVYVDSSDFDEYTFTPVMFTIRELLERKRCPIMKRRSFFTDYYDFLHNTCGEATSESYDFIRENTDYDVSLIWENLMRVENMAEVHRAMHLNYVLPTTLKYGSSEKKFSVALYVESNKRSDWYSKYLDNLKLAECVYIGGNGDIDIDVEKKDYIECSNYQEFVCKALAYCETEYLAVLNMKDIEKVRPYSDDWGWQYRDFECVFPTPDFIENTLITLEENPDMGMLTPPFPTHGRLFAEMGNGWNGKFALVKEALSNLELSVNIKENQAPIVPIGGSFWIRKTGLDVEKIMKINVADERVFLYALAGVTQASSKYIGVLYSDTGAAIEITNEDFMLRENNKTAFAKYGPNLHNVVVNRIKNS